MWLLVILYSRSSGEIRARVDNEAGDDVTNATLTCTLYNSRSRPTIVFSDRAMPYSSSHPFTDTTDLGCYFCAVTDLELASPNGTWKATITAEDAQGNVLVVDAVINVESFVVG